VLSFLSLPSALLFSSTIFHAFPALFNVLALPRLSRDPGPMTLDPVFDYRYGTRLLIVFACVECTRAPLDRFLFLLGDLDERR
jgi:hypothetical protein